MLGAREAGSRGRHGRRSDEAPRPRRPPRPVPPLAGTGGADPFRPHRRAPRRLCRLRPRRRRPARRRAARDRGDRAAGTAASAGGCGRCDAGPRPGRRGAAPQRRRGRGRLRRVDHAPERLRRAWRGDHPGPGTRERKACAGARPPPRRTEPARAPAEGRSGRRQALARLCPPGRAAGRRRALRGANRAPRHRPRHQPERHGRRHRPPSASRDPRLRALRRRSRQDRGGGTRAKATRSCSRCRWSRSTTRTAIPGRTR